MCILCGNDEHHPWEARGKAVWGWGRWGVLFSRPNCRFTIRKVFQKNDPHPPPQAQHTSMTLPVSHIHMPAFLYALYYCLQGATGPARGPVPTMCGQVRGSEHQPTRLLPPFQPSVRGPASRPHCFSQPSNQITYTHLTSCLSREGCRAGLGPWGTSLDSACLWYETGVLLAGNRAPSRQVPGTKTCEFLGGRRRYTLSETCSFRVYNWFGEGRLRAWTL